MNDNKIVARLIGSIAAVSLLVGPGGLKKPGQSWSTGNKALLGAAIATAGYLFAKSS